MENLDFLKHTASETIMQIVEKLYGGQSIVKDCPFKVFDLGIEETFGFEPNFWVDDADASSVILKNLGIKDE